MPIPSQNDFLLAPIQLFSDDKPPTRGQMRYRMA